MSGGVNSSVTALLLAKQDFDLSAIYMRNWDTRDESGTDNGCEWERDWQDVQLVCKKLDLPCEIIDLSREYWNRVFEPSLRQWELGVSPNPDVLCNKEIKFGALLDRLATNNRSYENAWLATGHYALKGWSSDCRPKLLRPVDRFKDQTYFLSAISEAGLRRALFPIGHLRKPEVRDFAKQHGLTTAERPDSVGICFVGEKAKFNAFLSSYIHPKPGAIINKLTGKEIGEHSGLWNFTIGQNARIPGMPEKLFVVSKNIENNTIYVVPGSAHESLFTQIIQVPEFTWIWKDSPPPAIDLIDGARLYLLHRYRTTPAPCTVRRSHNNGVVIECDEPQQAVTPGQVAALWEHDWCLGSGTIGATF